MKYEPIVFLKGTALEEGKDTVGVVVLKEQRASFMFVEMRSVFYSGPE